MFFCASGSLRAILRVRMGHFKLLCVPHIGNQYHPALLHGKRIFFYSLVFLVFKAIVVLAVLFVPHAAYLMPDVLAEQARQINMQTNELRRQNGLPKLAESAQLTASADAKAYDMIHNNYFSHTGPDNHTLAYFLQQAHYPYATAGENLAMGFINAESVLNAWKESSTHRANLLDAGFTDAGVSVELGSYRGEQTVFIVQHFGSKEQTGSVNATYANEVATVPASREIAINATSGVRPLRLVDYGTPSSPSVMFDRVASKVYWQVGEEGTSLLVKAKIYGSVKDAQVTVQGLVVPLSRESYGSQWYVGGVVVPQKPETFFRPVVLPAISITPTVGKPVRDSIDWYNIYVPEGTPVEQYFSARNLLTSFAGVFAASQVVFAFFLVVFGLVFTLTVVTRHHKLTLQPILQGMFSIGLLFVLWWI